MCRKKIDCTGFQYMANWHLTLPLWKQVGESTLQRMVEQMGVFYFKGFDFFFNLQTIYMNVSATIYNRIDILRMLNAV